MTSTSTSVRQLAVKHRLRYTIVSDVHDHDSRVWTALQQELKD